jgi:predicted ATPase
LRFTKVLLENWRNFTQVDARLGRRVFLVGPNASGKSNLLDAFRFLHDIVAIGGGLQSAVKNRGGVSRVRCLAARGHPDIGIRVGVGDDSSPGHWRYELRIRQDRAQRAIVKSEIVKCGGRFLIRRPDESDTDDPERLTQTSLEQVNVNRAFRPLVEFLESVRYLHLVPHLVRDPDRSIGRRNDPFGGDFLQRVAGTPQKTQKSRLRRIQASLKVAVPQLGELKLHRDDRGVPHLRGKYEHWRPTGAWQTESDFSDGTLRLIGLLWAVLEGSGPLLLEEPELSLHPEVVRCVPQLFARVQRRTHRQIIVSTHSRDLLQDEGIGLDEALLLCPQTEGTSVESASSKTEIRQLLENGVSLADAVMPLTRPRHAEQLMLFEP